MCENKCILSVQQHNNNYVHRELILKTIYDLAKWAFVVHIPNLGNIKCDNALWSIYRAS